MTGEAIGGCSGGSDDGLQREGRLVRGPASRASAGPQDGGVGGGNLQGAASEFAFGAERGGGGHSLGG